MKKLKLFYYDKNLGDELNKTLCEELFHVPVKKVTKARYADAVFVGSNMEKFIYYGKSSLDKRKLMNLLPPVKIWGTGFIEEKSEKNEFLKRRVDVHALRGYYSKERMENILKRKLENISLGDPGLLASELVTGEKEKMYKVGIIPHYIDKNCSLENISLSNSIIIDVQGDPINTVNKIASCEVILSSSLHGLIIADSMNIPNIRIKLSDNIVGGDYKYLDYYSIYGIEKSDYIDARKKFICDSNLQHLIERTYVEKKMDKIKRDLIDSFPYKSLR